MKTVRTANKTIATIMIVVVFPLSILFRWIGSLISEKYNITNEISTIVLR